MTRAKIIISVFWNVNSIEVLTYNKTVFANKKNYWINLGFIKDKHGLVWHQWNFFIDSISMIIIHKYMDVNILRFLHIHVKFQYLKWILFSASLWKVKRGNIRYEYFASDRKKKTKLNRNRIKKAVCKTTILFNHCY